MKTIERVARAIHAEHNLDASGWDERPDPVDWCGITQEDSFALARAALEAIREPSEGMKAAAARLNHPHDHEIWQAMITAILEEKD